MLRRVRTGVHGSGKSPVTSLRLYVVCLCCLLLSLRPHPLSLFAATTCPGRGRHLLSIKRGGDDNGINDAEKCRRKMNIRGESGSGSGFNYQGDGKGRMEAVASAASFSSHDSLMLLILLIHFPPPLIIIFPFPNGKKNIHIPATRIRFVLGTARHGIGAS